MRVVGWMVLFVKEHFGGRVFEVKYKDKDGHVEVRPQKIRITGEGGFLTRKVKGDCNESMRRRYRVELVEVSF